MKIMKLKDRIFSLLALVMLTTPMLTSCSDEPEDEYYYSFTGEMMSDYLKSRSQYSDFTSIVEKAGLMDLLASYGHYTCFLPDNSAVQVYLKSHNIGSIAELSPEQCDTIARTHLTSDKGYTTYDIGGGVTNMNKRFIQAQDTIDTNGQTVIMLNSSAIIPFETQNDSVENGIVQPITAMLESSTSMVPELMKKNPRLVLYTYALEKTGLADTMMKYNDEKYVQSDFQYKYKSGSEPWEIAIAPVEKRYGFTVFAVPDDVLLSKGYITTDPKADKDQALQELWALAKSIYDPMFPADAGRTFDMSKLNEPEDPLYKFMAYQALPRSMEKPEYLTVRDDLGIFTTIMNPTEWYETMLQYTLMKVEKYTVNMSGYGSSAKLNDHYVNRRFEKLGSTLISVEGVHVDYQVEAGYDNNAMNGFYFYVDDIIKYDSEVRDVVHNARMRVDMSALFPEMMTNGHRMNGDYQKHQRDAILDKDPSVGYNYYYPNGYLDGVTMSGDGYFVYRHPRSGYWSYSGDEMIVQGNFDVSFRILPVPVTGTYQVRLGYAAMAGVRTIAQFYFGDSPEPKEPYGVPVDMDVQMNNADMLGENFTLKYTDAEGNTVEGYTAVRSAAYNDDGSVKDEDAQTVLTNDQKALKNKGFYRGAFGCGCGTGAQKDKTHFAAIPQTFRIVLCTVKLEAGKYYYVRIRKATKLVRGNNECMLDYIEVVPKSVYGVSDGDMREDDL
jgi:hypothetical protein